jgi:hypothetical protein
MAQAFSLTGYNIEPVAGMYAQVPNHPQIHNAVISSASTSTTPVGFGYVVKLDTASTNSLAPVVEIDATATAPFGVVVYDPRVSEYVAGDKVALAQSGDIVYMAVGASAGVAVGDPVTVTGGNQVSKSSGTGTIGTAITVGEANGLVQVQLSF